MNESKLSEIELSRMSIFKGKVLDVELAQVLLPNKKQASRELVCHHGGVAVLALNSSAEVYFVRQYRLAVQEILWELPAGKLEKGEDCLLAAQRELLEETGLIAQKWQLLYQVLPSPGYTSEVLYIYLATELQEKAAQLDEDEFLEVYKLKIEAALALLQEGTIRDAKTVIALLAYLTRKGKLA